MASGKTQEDRLALLEPGDRSRVELLRDRYFPPCDEFALCVKLETPVFDTVADCTAGVWDEDHIQWKKSTHVIILYRDGNVKTIMLSRVGQLHAHHFRVEMVRRI